MKVAFDSRPAKDSRGIGRYARCLLSALRDLDRGEIIETHAERPSLRRLPLAWIDGALLRSPVPMVVTLHDLVPLKRRGEYLRSGLRFKLRYLAVQRAVRVIVPTRVVADDAINVLEIPADRITVIGEAVAPALHARSDAEVRAVRERYSLPDDYLLWVGGLRTPDPRKRVAALAGPKRSLPLVLVGEAGSWAHELPDVTLTGAVDDDELAAIYTGARALVFPSDDEGFGLPDEALACGTPVGGVRRAGAARGARRPCRADPRRRPRRAHPQCRVAAPPGARSTGLVVGGGGGGDLGRYQQALSAPVRWRGPRRRVAAPASGLRRPEPERRQLDRRFARTSARRRCAPGSSCTLAVAAEQVALAQQRVTEREQLVGGDPRAVTLSPRRVSFSDSSGYRRGTAAAAPVRASARASRGCTSGCGSRRGRLVHAAPAEQLRAPREAASEAHSSMSSSKSSRSGPSAHSSSVSRRYSAAAPSAPNAGAVRPNDAPGRPCPTRPFCAPVDDHCGGVDLAGRRGSDQLRRHRADARRSEVRPGGRQEPGLEHAVRVQQQHRVVGRELPERLVDRGRVRASRGQPRWPAPCCAASSAVRSVQACGSRPPRHRAPRCGR